MFYLEFFVSYKLVTLISPILSKSPFKAMVGYV